MEKVYIVTSGKYSDYGIDAVFKKREKAETYCKCHNGCRVNEWDFSDDKIFTTFDIIHVSGDIDTEVPHVEIKTYSQEDDADKEKDWTFVSFWGKDDISIDIFKVLPSKYDKNVEEEKAESFFWRCAVMVKNETKDCHDSQWYKEHTRWDTIKHTTDASHERFEIEMSLRSLLDEMLVSSGNSSPEIQ